jgi:hypothetical protein
MKRITLVFALLLVGVSRTAGREGSDSTGDGTGGSRHGGRRRRVFLERHRLARRRLEAIAGLEGVDAVVEPAEFARYGLPDPDRSDQMGALFVTAKTGHAIVADATCPVVADRAAASLGAHGYVATDPDLQAIFIASGRGIRAGVTLDRVDNLDIAPRPSRGCSVCR